MTNFHIRYNGKTHVGLQRKVNEDSILMMPEQQIYAVSDGMGGHEGGDLASRTVVDAITMLPDGMDPATKMHAIREALQSAHRSIVAEGNARGTTIGATVVALVLADGHWLALWAGDSRLYRLRDGQIEMLTSDHSVVAELVKSGRMNWDEAELHPQSNQITRAVGVGDELELEKVHGELLSGDRYLICSDGLTKYATFDQLRRAMVGAPIETLTEKLIQMALDGGGADNISVIVIDVI
ncbi:PP2C family protein-serine/threonine phosphatase [Frigidibacter sp. ROC022]|uniref:PP2C family protein-serine/threonine phosphatase n=1 Tax=Frigidibacter sp. ROC022 TaxID=2971796 RepID=UPI00215B2263|nr:protein phosphatase 2C domain-containing protein [Frigidibacter sp. ROC022]MCR8723342.1 protein phosphatase 2C domain-containing protein [Frigidibacter sp. ROC022]